MNTTLTIAGTTYTVEKLPEKILPCRAYNLTGPRGARYSLMRVSPEKPMWAINSRPSASTGKLTGIYFSDEDGTLKVVG